MIVTIHCRAIAPDPIAVRTLLIIPRLPLRVLSLLHGHIGQLFVCGDCLSGYESDAAAVLVGSREMRALGVESAYSTEYLVGLDRSMSDPAGSLRELAARVARTWSR